MYTKLFTIKFKFKNDTIQMYDLIKDLKSVMYDFKCSNIIMFYNVLLVSTNDRIVKLDFESTIDNSKHIYDYIEKIGEVII